MGNVRRHCSPLIRLRSEMFGARMQAPWTPPTRRQPVLRARGFPANGWKNLTPPLVAPWNCASGMRSYIHTYKPVLDDEPFRAFATTADYRRWCEEKLPDWLGYGRV